MVVPVVFFTEEPCLNFKQAVSYENKTAMWSWLGAGLKGMNGANLFKWLCFTEISKCLLEEHMDFLSPGKEKIHIHF